MSSPMINNVVILGCFFCYVFVFLLGIDSRFVDDHVFGTLCNVSGLSLYHLRKYSRIFLLLCYVFQNCFSLEGV